MKKKRWIAFLTYMIILSSLLIVELFFHVNISKYLIIFAGILFAIQLFTSVPFPDGGMYPFQEVENRTKDTRPLFPTVDFWIWTLGFSLYLLVLNLIK